MSNAWLHASSYHPGLPAEDPAEWIESDPEAEAMRESEEAAAAERLLAGMRREWKQKCKKAEGRSK